MSIFKNKISAIKNWFFDGNNEEEKNKHEEVELVPEVESPIKNTNKNKDPESELELFQDPKTFKFPITFEPEETQKPITPEKPSLNVMTQNVLKYQEAKPAKEEIKPEVKVFHPTPIISPVYGVLDKNYRKEEVVEKKEVVEFKSNQDVFDMVRQKAFGTLSEEIEDTLTRIAFQSEEEDHEPRKMVIKQEKTTEVSFEDDLLSDLKDQNYTLEEMEKIDLNKIPTRENKRTSRKKPVHSFEDTDDDIKLDNEKDLFNLIDTMYDKEVEE